VHRSDHDLLDRLATGPSFLLIGQSWPTVGPGVVDPLAQSLRRAAGVAAGHPYEQLLALRPPDRERVIEDLTDLSRTSEPPDWLRQVGEFPWNGVFTTAIDGLVPRAFDAEWRRVVPVVGRDVRRQSRRSPTELRLVFLYGGVGLAPGSEPPADRPSFAIRRSEAQELLSELAEGLLTPRGVLVVEGLATSDWLAPEDLYALASQLLPGQVHLFSASREVVEDEFIQAAIASRSVVTHTSSLAQFLGSAAETGSLARPPLQVDVDARFLRLSGHLHPVPRDVWNRVLPAGRPLDAAAGSGSSTTPSWARASRDAVVIVIGVDAPVSPHRDGRLPQLSHLTLTDRARFNSSGCLRRVRCGSIGQRGDLGHLRSSRGRSVCARSVCRGRGSGIEHFTVDSVRLRTGPHAEVMGEGVAALLVHPKRFGSVPSAQMQAHEPDVAVFAVRVQRDSFFGVAESVVLEGATGQALHEHIERA
jgi:hypothetical protein